jgi:peptide/nickel transport system substrate-binding protein
MTDPKRYNPQAPWADKRVRQALNYAIDKKAIAKNIFSGEATPAGAATPISQWMDIPPYPYDPAKAKQLLADAGYPKGFPITMKTCATIPGAELPTVGEAIAMYWKAIGLDVKIVPTDWNTIRGEWTGGKSNSYVWTHRGFASVSMINTLTTEFVASTLFASYASKETEDRTAKIASELDPKKKDKSMRDFGQYLRDEAVQIFLVYANEPYGASKKVGNWPVLRRNPKNIELITHP